MNEMSAWRVFAILGLNCQKIVGKLGRRVHARTLQRDATIFCFIFGYDIYEQY